MARFGTSRTRERKRDWWAGKRRSTPNWVGGALGKFRKKGAEEKEGQTPGESGLGRPLKDVRGGGCSARRKGRTHQGEGCLSMRRK